MTSAAEITDDLRNGRLDLEQLLDRLVLLERHLQTATARIAVLEQHNAELEKHNAELEKHNAALAQRIAELEKQLDNTNSATPAKVTEPFSVHAEEKRQEARGRKKRRRQRSKRRGRLNTADKIKRAERSEDVYPDGVDPKDCRLSHTRPVWRLKDGRAVLIAYHVYRGPRNQYGKIPGVLGRSEFGLEIVVTIGYLVHLTGLSLDKVCLVLGFFQNLQLGKSQADALLRQLARHWDHDFEILCTLLANSLVVHTDETGWSLNSVWAFLSENARVLLFGVPKDADTLKVLLDPESFTGLVISDDAAVYANFTYAQKCWAHLLRKAIKLTLQEPHREDYRQFADQLLEIYRAACRTQRDGRLGAAGRQRQVSVLEDQLADLCHPLESATLSCARGFDNDFRLLVNEVLRLLQRQELFTFVTAKPATQPNGATLTPGATNNEAERTLRSPAQARDTGRTNKTLVGARCRTILTSVLESLRLYLKSFTLSSVLAEVQRWGRVGRSCFAEQLKKRKLSLPQAKVLDRLFPSPSG
jgi:transposase